MTRLRLTTEAKPYVTRGTPPRSGLLLVAHLGFWLGVVALLVVAYALN